MVDTFRDEQHHQRLLQDAELMITEDTEEAKWFDPTEGPDVRGTTHDHGASRRPATAPPGTPGNNGELKRTPSVKFDASVVDRPRPSTTDGRGRASASSATGKAAADPFGGTGRTDLSRSTSPGPHSDGEDDYVRTQAISHRALYARFSSPKDDYILPPSTHPINGTYRNPPDGHLIEKLRYALLRLTRDKYRSGKREKILNEHIGTLKTEIKELEHKIRHLQIELAEYRGHSDGIEFAATFHGKQPVWAKEKTFGPMDEVRALRRRFEKPFCTCRSASHLVCPTDAPQLFKTMIERRAFNPVDMILQVYSPHASARLVVPMNTTFYGARVFLPFCVCQFRRIVDYLSRLPGSLNVGQVTACPSLARP